MHHATSRFVQVSYDRIGMLLGAALTIAHQAPYINIGEGAYLADCRVPGCICSAKSGPADKLLAGPYLSLKPRLCSTGKGLQLARQVCSSGQGVEHDKAWTSGWMLESACHG